MPGKLCNECGRSTPPNAVRCPACGFFVPAHDGDDLLEIIQGVDASLGPHYRVEEEIGRGGAAIVYGVVDERLHRRLALKLLNPVILDRSDTAVRFRREAETSAALSHPNIVQIFFVGDVESHPFYVMPLIEGESLGARLRREGRLSIQNTCTIAQDIASALDFAHRKGVIHRDVKPDNVLLEASTGRSLLMDFGIAKAIGGEPGITGTGFVVGTPLYVSPEQASGGDEVDLRTDLYSLGIMVYEMLTGTVPFDGENAQALFAQHAVAEVPSLRDRCPDVPVKLEGVVNRALAKKPDDRYASAGEFVTALEKARGRPSLRVSGGTVMKHQARDDISQFRSLDTTEHEGKKEALDRARDPAEAAEAAEVMERRLLRALDEAKWIDLGTGLEVLIRRQVDHRPAYRQPVERVLRHLSAEPRTVELLARGWRTAAPDNQSRIEQVLVGLFDIDHAVVELACRERSPALMLLADRVGALTAETVGGLAGESRSSAVEAFLEAVGESNRPPDVVEQWLIRVLRHPNQEVRILTLRRASERGGPMAERIGRLGLSDREPAVREQALRTMGGSRRREVLPALAQRLENGTRPEQVAAALALGDLGRIEAIPVLERVFHRRRFLKSERGPVQRAAAEALARFQGEDVRPVLETLSRNADSVVRATAQEALDARK